MTLTPLEVLRLGIEAGHSPDVMLASLEAAGWACAPIEPTRQMVEAAWIEGHLGATDAGVLVREYSVNPSPGNLSEDTAYEVYQAMLSARPK